MKQLHDIDLNLLTVFRALDEARHVTRAAKKLGVTQPALSHGLRRLRELLGDPLFVRTPKGMVRTPRAEALSPVIGELVAMLEREILGRTEFVPRTLRRTFRLMTTDMVESQLIPRFLENLETLAPEVRISTTGLGFELPKAKLEDGSCDLAIAGFFGELAEGFYKQRLFEDSFLCAVRKGHPRLGVRDRLTIDAFCEERHVLIAPGGELTGPVDRILSKMKRARSVPVGVSSYMVAGWIVAGSDSLLTGPGRLIRQLSERFPLQTYVPPLAIAKIQVAQVWHERNHADPGHSWFRDQVKRVLQGDGPR